MSNSGKSVIVNLSEYNYNAEVKRTTAKKHERKNVEEIVMGSKWLEKTGYTLLIVLATVVAVFTYLGYSASRKYHLQSWHKAPEWRDQLTKTEFADFAGYLAAEQELIDNIYASVEIKGETSYHKYDKNNPSTPYRNGKNLNASFEFLPTDKEIVGGILLVHGLTDSPYHVRAIGKLFADNGYYVIGLRLPGHGTVPGALLNVSWQDWYDAVKFGARTVQNKIKNIENSKFYVGGFSTGGALTLRYVLESVADTAAVVPDKLLLLSPAIGINRLAGFMNWHILTSWVFEAFKWLEIKPEYDPFKYNSFAKNAAKQIYNLTVANQELMDKLAENTAGLAKMPPIHAFQSCVDATVQTRKLLEMFGKIAPRESALLLFDVNRKYEAALADNLSLTTIVDSEQIKDIDATVIMVTNKPQVGNAGYENEVRFKPLTKAGEATAQQMEQSDELSGLEWPNRTFALSHVCIPISPNDYFYGDKSILGTINAKGEHDVLVMGNDLLRLRYNPFFDLLKLSITQSFIAL